MIKNTFIITLLCVMTVGCSSHYGAAQIVSTPAGAEVVNLEDGTLIGITPVVAWWKDGEDDRQHVALRFKKDGYYEKVTSFWLSMRHSSLEKAKADVQLVEVTLADKPGE